ncbi:MAG: proprotein convertase P-domain-containing protein [Saprospiraceae bacterium]|uniref:Proprotein convertase P-domain-containing protein n=1 Tax=Candidatus Opimibacter skivensis TaxID=2982028 RepID=A0A9D7SXE8_9BACT|nr:proprotein convertase P-domain-containing protein [Candidatus Opimibacter skivensis]
MKYYIILFSLFGFSFSILQAQTFPGSAGALTDNNCAGAFNTFSATVSNVGVTDVIQSVTINISHTWDSDLNIFLVGPTGTIIELSTGNGGSGVNYVNTIFTDSAPSFITTGTAPFTGSFKPEGRANTDIQCDPTGTVGTYTFASQFAGTNTNGNWTLKIKDGASGDVGILNSWSVTIAPMQTLQKVGINTANPQATLDVNGKVKIGDDTAQQSAGMIRFSTMANDFEGFNGSVWKSMTGLTSGGGSGNGLVHPTAGSTFESGTSNPGMTGINNTAIGVGAGDSFTSGTDNTAFGNDALTFTSTGKDNVAIGSGALSSLHSDDANVAIGKNALHYTVNGFNVAVGYEALYHNAQGSLFSDDGIANTAVGNGALRANTVASFNTAMGNFALEQNISGFNNTAIGSNALGLNLTGDQNTALGYKALQSYKYGNYNTAVGYNSLTTSGLPDDFDDIYNTALGWQSGYDIENHDKNTFLGADASSTVLDGLTNSTAIGYSSRATANNQIRVGNSSITSIGGYAGWTNISDGRFKNNIKEDVHGLDFILKLRPVTYQLAVDGISTLLEEDKLKNESEEEIIKNTIEKDKQNRLQKEEIVYTGFIAQEVDKSANEIGFDFSGIDKPQNDKSLWGLRYGEFVVPLVKAVQEQQKMIDTLIKENKNLNEYKAIFQTENTVLREDAGVALAGIQELAKENQELKAEIQSLRSMVETLMAEKK